MSRANGKNINMTEVHLSCRQIKTVTMKLPSRGRMRNPTKVHVFLASSRHRKKRPSEGKTTVLRYPFISYLWLKHTSSPGFYVPGGSVSRVRASLWCSNRNGGAGRKLK